MGIEKAQPKVTAKSQIVTEALKFPKATQSDQIFWPSLESEEARPIQTNSPAWTDSKGWS